MRTKSTTGIVVLAHLRLSFVELLAGESIPGAPSRHEPGLGVAYLKREIARESACMGTQKNPPQRTQGGRCETGSVAYFMIGA